MHCQSAVYRDRYRSHRQTDLDVIGVPVIECTSALKQQQRRCACTIGKKGSCGGDGSGRQGEEGHRWGSLATIDRNSCIQCSSDRICRRGAEVVVADETWYCPAVGNNWTANRTYNVSTTRYGDVNSAVRRRQQHT